MKRRHWIAFAALVLLGLGAWLMQRGSTPPSTPEPRVELPRALKPEERDRMQRRQLMLPAVMAPGAAAAPSRRTDPVLSALAAGPGKLQVVFEANAIRNSPVGELLLDCLQNSPGSNPLEEMKAKTGVDVLKDVDRVAVSDKGLVVSGSFGQAKLDQLFPGAQAESYGAAGSVYALGRESGGSGVPTVATWGSQLFVMGGSPDAAKEAVDRIEGRAPTPGALSPDQTYGEIYGVVPGATLAQFLGRDQAELAGRLRQVADKVELHVDTMHDIGIVANVTGPSAADVQDLGKAIGALFSAGRVKAQLQGDADMAALLKDARVVPADGAFRVELALPLSFLEQKLAHCKKPKPAPPQPLAAPPPAAGDGPVPPGP